MDILDGKDEYLMFTLDKGETWADKAKEIHETLMKWRLKHVENHA